MNRVRVSIAGASGYTGGELLRILLFHPGVEVSQITSRQYRGKSVKTVHPNLRFAAQLKFCDLEELQECDLLFLALPHNSSMHRIEEFTAKAGKIIDLSSDFRLRDSSQYPVWYGEEHPSPELLEEFVYGIPELHREEMRNADFVSSAGCNATATILPLYPFYREGLIDIDRTVVEVKAGTSQGGNSPSAASHHPQRNGSLRIYKSFGHRHIAEMNQELGVAADCRFHFTATSLNMVRGIQSVSHLFLNQDIDEKEIWKLYRSYYNREPFIRIVKEKSGIYRLPDPKILQGTNICEIGFEKDPDSNRIVVISALDNLMKGAAGQAVQAMNIMYGMDETLGLEFPGLHPV